MSGYTTCWNHVNYCRRQDGSYDKDCLRRYEANCVGTIPELCEVTCARIGELAPGATCQSICEHEFPKFRFVDTHPQQSLQNNPLCAGAFAQCVDADGAVDEECLKGYTTCRGNLAQHCDLACIRTPGSKCHQQCTRHYLRLGGNIPSPLKGRQIWGRQY